MSTCFHCGSNICEHPFIKTCWNHQKNTQESSCQKCGEINPSFLCLPTRESKIDFNSDVYSITCKDCYNMIFELFLKVDSTFNIISLQDGIKFFTHGN